MDVVNIDILKKFLESNYARHLIFKTNKTEVLLVCWLPDQGADFHEHGESDAITLILEGQMSYTTIYPGGTKVSGVLMPGDIEHIPPGVKHKVRNNTNERLVSLHVYSPPLEEKLLNYSLGYANKIKLQEVHLLEKTISYLMAEKPLSKSTTSNTLITNRFMKSLKPSKQDPQKVSIAIIGGGFSGTLVATHLMKKETKVPMQIFLIEKAPKFAKGFAYSTSSPMHLLNVPTSKMSAFPCEPDHFLRWINKKDSSIDTNSFASRMLYGEYLEEILHEAELSKPTNISFNRLNDEAVSVEHCTDDSTIISLQSGAKLPANFVVLAVGNHLPRNPTVANKSFYSSNRYIRNPWSKNSLGMLSLDDPVLLIGTGLTMVDKVIELKCKGHRGPIYAISRHGFLPQVHNLDIKTLGININFKEPFKLVDMFKEVREKIGLANSLGGDWREIIDAVRLQIQRIWMNLTLIEKKRFCRHLRPYWDVHRHRIPKEVAGIINSMLETSELKIIKGRVNNYLEEEDHVKVTIKERTTSKFICLNVARVINCTGSEVDFCRIEDPLITTLLEQGVISPDKLSLGLEALLNGALLDKQGNASKVFYSLGPPLKGMLWETIAVPEIREQASTLANELTEKAKLLFDELVGLNSPSTKVLQEQFNYTI